VISYEKNVVAARKSRACENPLTSDLPGAHFDGRPIDRERPFLVGLGCVICRPTNDAKLDRAKFFRMLSRPGASDPQAVRAASRDISLFMASSNTSTGRGTPAAPVSQPSEVGDSLQFLSALLAPANSSERLWQASARTNPRSCQTQIASTCSRRKVPVRTPAFLQAKTKSAASTLPLVSGLRSSAQM